MGIRPPLVLEAGAPGMINKLQFVEDPAAPDLAPTKIEIKASVWPISSRDISIVLGRMDNAGLGLECAGTISRVGAASNRFTPGGRVLMVHPGAMRSFPRASADSVFKLLQILSFNDAVAGIVPSMAAWYALVQVGRLQHGEKVLIHDAADGTGQMAIKIAKMLGAEIFATVDAEKKRKLIIDLDIPESHVFYSRDSSFVKGVKRITNDYGIDVILNSLSGQGLRASWECIAPYGRFVNLEKSDIIANSSLPMASFANNVSFASVDLQHITLKNSALVRQLVETALSLVADPEVGGPAPLHFFPVSQIREAFRFMEAGKDTGRTLVTIEPKDVVPVRLNLPSSAIVEA